MKHLFIKATFVLILSNIGFPSYTVPQEVMPVTQNLSDSAQVNESNKSGNAEKFEKYFYLVHYYDHFKKPFTLNWHLTSLQAKFKSNEITYMGFINYGQVLSKTAEPFNSLDMQYRLDAYPIFNDHNYAYLSYAFSASEIFPTHQARGIFYHQFGKGYEVSGGMYYMMWDEPFLIYTGSVAKYLGQYWFSLRPYFQIQNGTLYQSYLLFARRYLGSPDDYLNLMLGYGSSPDNQAYLYNFEDIYSLEAYNVQLNYQKSLKNWLILAGAGLKIEEYKENKNRNHLHFEVGISYKF